MLARREARAVGVRRVVDEPGAQPLLALGPQSLAHEAPVTDRARHRRGRGVFQVGNVDHPAAEGVGQPEVGEHVGNRNVALGIDWADGYEQL